MKKEKNLIESKVLVNTFKRFKSKNYLNKSFLKKNLFYILKYKTTNLYRSLNFFKIFFKKIGFLGKYNCCGDVQILKKFRKNLFIKIIIFV